MKKWSILYLFIFGLLTCNTTIAQSADFSGRWQINKEKVEWGEAPEFVLPRALSINQQKDIAEIERTVLSEKLEESKYTEKLKFDGVESEVTTATSKRKSSLKWNTDGKTFVVSTQSTKLDGGAGSTITEIWSLEDGGKTIVVNREVEQFDGFKYSIKAVFDKL